LAIGAFFIWLLFRRVDFQALAYSLRETRYFLLVPSLALVFVSFVMRTYRWRFFFVGDGHIPFRKLFTATMIGYMGNVVLPARAGEFIRAYVISRTGSGVAATKAFATIVAERVLDGACLVVLLCLSMLVLPSNKPVTIPSGTLFERPVTIHLEGLAGTALGVLAVAVALAALIYLRKDAVSRIVGKVFAVFSDRAAQHVTHSVESFASGLDIVRDKRRLASVSFLSLLVWLPAGLAIYPVLRAFPTEVQWPWYTSLVVLAVVCVGIMVPAAPGFVGTFHAACVAGLLLCAPVDFDTALAFSVVYHGANMVVLVIAGLICLGVENVSFLEVVRRAESGTAEDAPAS
jgi:uncharacterized protein (TIRG00374 family)